MKKIFVIAVCSIAIAAISTSAVIAVSNSSNFDEATRNEINEQRRMTDEKYLNMTFDEMVKDLGLENDPAYKVSLNEADREYREQNIAIEKDVRKNELADFNKLLSVLKSAGYYNEVQDNEKLYDEIRTNELSRIEYVKNCCIVYNDANTVMTEKEKALMKEYLTNAYSQFKEISIKDKPLEDIIVLLESTL